MARCIAAFEREERELLASLAQAPNANKTVGERIREARHAGKIAQLRMEQSTTPALRATNARVVAVFEKLEYELLLEIDPYGAPTQQARLRASRARAVAAVARVEAQIAQAYDASPAGQSKRHTQQIIENFTRVNQRLPQDPKPVASSGGGYGTWRGQKLPGPTWRGKPIR